MKKSFRTIALAVTAAYVISLCACAVPGPVGSTQPGSGERVPSAPEDLPEPEDAEVILGGDQPELPKPSASVLGSLSFTPDPSRSARGEYFPDGEGLILEVKDTQGLLWRLEISKGACPSAETIVMTALGDVTGDVLSTVESGVLLEPDGLRFVRPAILTASGPDIKGMALLTADHGGKRLAYAPGKHGGEEIGIELAHFSSAFTFDDEDQGLDGLKSIAAKMLEEEIEMARQLLREPVSVPVPPDISFKCSEESCDEPDTTCLTLFLDAFMSPELYYMEELAMAGQNYSLVYGSDGQIEESLAILGALAGRYVKKADKLFAEYCYDPDKCLAVSYAVLSGLSQCALCAADMDYDAYHTIIAEWYDKTWDYYYNELRRKHDFKCVHAILRIGYYAEMMGSSRNYLEELQKAMNMTVRFTTELTLAEIVFDLAGEIRIPYNGQLYYQTGSGAGRYTGFSAPDMEMALPNGFEVKAVVENFNPCKDETINVYIDRFGAESESFGAEGVMGPVPGGMVHPTGKLVFSARAAQDVSEKASAAEMLYRFELPFTNGSETMGEQEFNENIDVAHFKYNLKLQHTPE